MDKVESAILSALANRILAQAGAEEDKRREEEAVVRRKKERIMPKRRDA